MMIVVVDVGEDDDDGGNDDGDGVRNNYLVHVWRIHRGIARRLDLS